MLVIDIKKYLKNPLLIGVLVFLLAFILRIYHLDKLYVFGADEEYQTDIAMTLVKHLHPIWIGVSAANTGFYLGPFWSYFTYIWLLLSHGQLLITGYIAALLGALTTLTIFYIGGKMFSLRIGIAASVLYACLPLIVFYDQKFWTPTIVPLLSITMVYALYKVKDNQRYWLLFALAYGLVFHIDLEIAPFILLAIYQLRMGIQKNVLIQSVLIFLLIESPLIVFDYFHKWSNITTPLRFAQIASVAHANLLEKVYALGVSIMRLWYLPPYSINANEILAACSKYRSSPSLLTLPFVLLILIFLFKRTTWIKENQRILGLGILLISLSYVLYPGRLDEYYLLGLFPLLTFIPGIIWNKYLGPLIIASLCMLGIISILTAYNPYGLAVKRQIIYQVMSRINNQPYDLTESGECHRYEGWRYLFSVYSRAPERSSIDYAFGWLYPKEITSNPVKYSVVITGHDTNNLGFDYKISKH